MSENFEINSRPTSAGLIIIGDEILKGQVIDTNSSFILPKLRQRGILVKKISVIGDDTEEVAHEVKEFSGKYNYVITSGGIGPTHDDVTYEAVAKAFNSPLELSSELYQLCKIFYNVTDENSPLTKEARIPKNSNITFCKAEEKYGVFPLVSVHNVFIFPGIPRLFQALFNGLVDSLFHSLTKFHVKKIYFKVGEEKIAELLRKVSEELPNIQIGSYPIVENVGYNIMVTIESTKKESVEHAYDKLLSEVPETYIAHLHQ